MTQMTCPDNFGLFQRAVIMSGMIRSPYAEEGMGIPPSLDEAEKLGEKFFNYLGVKTLAEARQLDAKYIRDCYDKFMYENEIMVNVKGIIIFVSAIRFVCLRRGNMPVCLFLPEIRKMSFHL